LKTLDDQQLRQFARLTKDLLKPAGRAAFVEIHVPENRLLRWFYLFYIRHVIPTVGRLCLGNPNCYRHLALYTEDYAKRDFFADYLKEAGLEVDMRPLFFGCARLYVAALA
jgi:demethylmenaquinone methyltransferase/2-methoxy-6-polyprenyl-1,4-benzoquinol methylase